MPIYFFHLRGGRVEADDDEGIVLSGIVAARAEAVRSARSILAAEILEGRLPLGERVVVVDEAGREVLDLPFAVAVEQDR